jgi:hypothetical protein
MAIYGVVGWWSACSAACFVGAMSAWMPNMMQQMNLPLGRNRTGEQWMRLLMGAACWAWPVLRV